MRGTEPLGRPAPVVMMTQPDLRPSDPQVAYSRGLADRRTRVARADDRLSRLGLGRLGLGGALLVLAALAVGFGLLSAWWLLAPGGALAALFVLYDREQRRKARALAAAGFFERGLARVEERWAGTGDAGERYLRDDHLYAADLDLFGAGSIFERMCEARTRAGRDLLAAWLLAPADPATVRARQVAVADLRPRLAWRERLALLGGQLPQGVDTTALVAWGAQQRRLPLTYLPLVPHLFAILLGLSVFAAAAGWVGAWAVAGVLIGQAVFVLIIRDRVATVLAGVEGRARDLFELSGLVGAVEGEAFSADRLVALQEALKTGGVPPSKRLAQLARLVDLLDSRRNQLFIPIALLLMWGTRMAIALEAWRVRTGPALARWFAAVAEVEALASIAGYAFECPNDPFPEVVAAGPVFDGASLGHPLIPPAACVGNDVALGRDRLRVLVVSGSNMSGKSTLLRTVGTNAVLALAGAPVRAARLTVSPLVIGATLRIQDSLRDGRSRFYAEVLRLRRIVEAARGPVPVLFLLDELLHGTNSHDRGIGAEAVVRTLAERGAIGLLTTHDLALAHIAEALGPAAANVHFADELRDGVMAFDYAMRPGVVRHSNALALMRAAGLDV